MRGLLTARETDVSSSFRLYLTGFIRKYRRGPTLYLLLSICVYVCPSLRIHLYLQLYVLVCVRACVYVCEYVLRIFSPNKILSCIDTLINFFY